MLKKQIVLQHLLKSVVENNKNMMLETDHTVEQMAEPRHLQLNYSMSLIMGTVKLEEVASEEVMVEKDVLQSHFVK